MPFVQLQFIAHAFIFYPLHFAFLLYKNQQSIQFWERLQFTLSLLHVVSNKQGKNSKCDSVGAVESGPGSGCGWC